MRNICPICGYDKLEEEPYNESGYGSDEICVCCGFQFGYDDFPNKEESYVEWREKWICDNYKWFSRKTLQPKEWNIQIQLKNIKIK